MPSTADLLPGTYVCIRTRALAGYIVRAATHSSYDHVVLAGPGGTTVESTPRAGVHIGSVEAYKGLKAAANTGEALDAAEREAVLAAARRYVGEQYNWAAIAADALADLGWHWRLLLRVARADKRLVCSQLVAAAGNEAGLKSWACGKESPALVTPGELADRPGVEPVEI